MIKRLLLDIYLWIGKEKRQLKWYFEFRKIKAQGTNAISIEPLPKGKYLVLIPHSDDEWIGCSTIIKDPSYDVVLCNMNMPGGDNAKIHAIRRKEMEQIAQISNRKLIICKNESDLGGIIKDEKPTKIVVPYIIDWHEEHLKVMHILAKALSVFCKQCDIVMCQITIPISLHNITHANKMNKQMWKNKWLIFRKNYRTQKYFPWFRISCHERLNGEMFGCFSAEVFCVLESNKWLKVFNNSKPSVGERQQIKLNLGSLQLSREWRQKHFNDDNK